MAEVASPGFPAAEGVRMQWAEIPARVRGEIERELGAPVRSAASQAGGFSPGVAARLQLDDGTRAFVKAVSSTPNADSPNIHRREARIAAELPAAAPVPSLRWSYDDGEWVVLVFDDIDGKSPTLPWEPDELTRVMLALYEVSRALTPSPIVVEPASEWMARLFGCWSKFADDAAATDRLSAGWRTRIDDLVALEANWPAAVAGGTLLHLDTRADNLLLTDDRVYVVDWPWATIGTPWVDLVSMLPSVAMQGGPDPELLWGAHPLARGVDRERVDAFLAALAGMFSWQSLQSPAPGLPTLRPFQAALGKHVRAWLARRRGWV
jgi:hypothetical protein